MGIILPLHKDAEYDPQTYLKLVQAELEQGGRGDLVAVVALVLDSEGGFSIHTSTTDRERRHAILSVALDYSIEELRNAMTAGFESEPVGGPDNAA